MTTTDRRAGFGRQRSFCFVPCCGIYGSENGRNGATSSQAKSCPLGFTIVWQAANENQSVLGKKTTHALWVNLPLIFEIDTRSSQSARTSLNAFRLLIKNFTSAASVGAHTCTSISPFPC